VYTPLHGSGAMPVIRALTELGVNVIPVSEQKEPDGNFPTVKYPNPEEASALKLAIDLAIKVDASLVIATDPDADRIGIAIKDGSEFRLVNGNQLGALLEEYILSSRKELNLMPQNPVIIKTIVTTELQREIAKYYEVECIDTLTGFKYIGEKIREFEEQKNYSYVFGGEESYGYLVNTNVRDKDAVSAAVITVEMALFNYLQNQTLYDKLKEIWKKFGYFEETQISKKFEGESGFKNMNALMERLRSTPPLCFDGIKILKIKDYQKRITKILQENVIKQDIFLPSSNVLQFILEDNSIISVRPSGTEPKIKFYISSQSKVTKSLENAIAEVKKKIEFFKEEINSIIEGA
ncbi:MAG: phospho-sugar mutase, partial [Chitinispirillaceae bacterium]|nr:phospho-sugar mutase [Chitinispirillaceae bacterium]